MSGLSPSLRASMPKRCPHCGKRIVAASPRVTRQPGIVARARKRKANQDARYAAKIRATVRERDGYCRFAKDAGDDVSACHGRSEWAHIGEQQRFKTRGQAPATRHTTRLSMQLCAWHHRAYDVGEIGIELLTDRGCDGRVWFTIPTSAI